MPLPSGRIHKPVKREYFASPFTVIATVGSVIFFLYLIFPRQSLMDLLATSRNPDPLARNYLNTLVQVEPANHGNRLLLARQEMALGNSAQAKAVLKPLLESGNPALRWESLRTTFEITRKEVFSHPESSLERSKGLVQLRTLLDEMATGPWSKKELEHLARESMALGNQRAAIRYLERLAFSETTPANAETAAQMALAVGDYRRSAEFYFLAQARLTDPAGRKKYFMAGVRALQSGNLPDEALAAADKHLAGLENDREILLYLARLAFSARRGQIAENYLKRLLNFGG